MHVRHLIIEQHPRGDGIARVELDAAEPLLVVYSGCEISDDELITADAWAELQVLRYADWVTARPPHHGDR